MKHHALCWMALAALVLTAAAPAGSIWDRGQRRTRAIFSDDSAADIGDSLTIKIEEASTIGNKTARTLEKKTTREADAGGSVAFGSILDMFNPGKFDFPSVEYDSGSTNKLDGKADYDKSRSFVDEISVTVQDVQPNGNLVVLGKRSRTVDGDTQVIEVSGIVRPSDINFDNQVSSKRVANFHIVYRGKGLDNQFTRPGWAGTIMNFFSPF